MRNYLQAKMAAALDWLVPRLTGFFDSVFEDDDPYDRSR